MGRSNTARRDQKPRLISYPATLGLVPYVKVGIDLRHSQLDVVRRSSYRDTVVLRVAVSLLSLLGDAEGTRRSWAPEHHHRSSMLQWLPPQKQKRVDWQALLWLCCHPIGLDGNGPSRIVFPVAPVFPSGRGRSGERESYVSSTLSYSPWGIRSQRGLKPRPRTLRSCSALLFLRSKGMGRSSI